MEHHALRTVARARDAFADLFEQLGSEAAERRELALLQRGFEIGDAVHFQLVVEELDALRAQARNAQEIEETGRDRRDELLALGHAAGLDERRDLFGNAAADSGEIREVEFATCDELGDGIRVIGDRARRVAIRPHFEGIARGDFQEIGDFTEGTRDFGVLHAVKTKACGASSGVIG